MPPLPPAPPRPLWDIFCAVVDNFGDIGVCWRLARQLVHERGQPVRLWVDDLAAFARLCPVVDPGQSRQTIDAVEVIRWRSPLPALDPGDVVIEAFACRLPDAFEAAMAARRPPPRWLNLEYLSAESWVAGCHGMASPHPRLPLVKHFFFPGFTPDVGGLLREDNLPARQSAFSHDAWWRSLGFPGKPAGLTVSLFAYENPAVVDLVAAWAEGPLPVTCLVPESRILGSLQAVFGGALRPGADLQRGALTLRVVPFVAQERYDELLWACDLNFVRGEDSLVRALWAERPFVWHIYPQDDGAHWPKLDALCQPLCAQLDPAAATALERFWRSWNAGQLPADAWTALCSQLPAIAAGTARFSRALRGMPDLATSLVRFCANAV